MSERKRIRALYIEKLKSAAFVDEKSLFNSRVSSIGPKLCPAINVFTPSMPGRSTAGAGKHIPSFDYELTVRIDIHVSALSTAWADELDDLCEVVTEKVFRDAAFLKEINVSGFSSHSTEIEASGEGDKIVAVAMMEFVLNFSGSYPPVIEDDLKTLNVDVDSIDIADPNTGHENEVGGYPGGNPGPDGRIEANMKIELEQ